MSVHRPRDPQPISRPGEIALVVLTGVVLMLGYAAMVGVGAAAAMFGGGWVWPQDMTAMTEAVAGLLRGRPGAGMSAGQVARLPGPVAVYGCVVVSEVLTMAAACAAAVQASRYVRPSGDPRRGMATRGEAAAVLGVRRLRAARTVIRPDMYDRRQGSSPRPPR